MLECTWIKDLDAIFTFRTLKNICFVLSDYLGLYKRNVSNKLHEGFELLSTY